MKTANSVHPKTKPDHHHDCEACIYCGKMEFNGVRGDVFVCPGHGISGPTLIHRIGPGSEYFSISPGGLVQVPQMAWPLIAFCQAAGVLKVSFSHKTDSTHERG